MIKQKYLAGVALGAVVAFWHVGVHAADLEQGEKQYKQLCASCHGDKGAADGPVAKALPPGTVTNLKSATYKYATDDKKMAELIKKGGVAVGLSAMMPPQAGLSDEAINAIVAYVMTLRD